ncbi:sensor histidine kinase [Hymenobacter terricola]|uniref:sensor histidine kinase n=1 Tax=Hymenobacter terricola TaxID=2819236 RepID=UPI001B312A52|nr:histidine kinase [Hymenobacter terricola]
MKNWLHHRVARHVLFWAAVSAFLWLIQLPNPAFIGERLYWRTYLVSQLPTLVLGTYSLMYGLLPRLLLRRQPGQFLLLLLGWLVVCGLVSNLLWLFFGSYLTPVVFGGKPFLKLDWGELIADLNAGFFEMLIVAGIASAIKVFNQWYEQRQLSLLLLQRKLHTELELLKARLQPAFLFNTLRTLQALTEQKSPESPAAVLHLSALLRYLLYESQLAEVPLAEEVALMQHYVALERLRLGSRVEVSLSFSGALEAHTIAPLLLLPFVENAFRHGADTRQDYPWVSLDLVAKKNSFTFKVINSRPQTGPAPDEETELGSVRERLARLYPDQHELKMVADPDTFLVVLHLRRAPTAATAASLPAARPAVAPEFHPNA